MTPHQIQLVRSTFAAVSPNAAGVAALFYGRYGVTDEHYATVGAMQSAASLRAAA